MLKIGRPHLEPSKMGNSQMLGLVKRTPGHLRNRSNVPSALQRKLIIDSDFIAQTSQKSNITTSQFLSHIGIRGFK